MKVSILGFGDVSIALPTDALDDACTASERTGRCVVLFWPCGADKVAAIVCDNGFAVWACVEDSQQAAEAKAHEAIRSVYPHSVLVGDLA